MYKKIIIANWKSHPATIEEAQELFKAETEAAQKYSNVKVVICPPAEFLNQLSRGVVGTVFASLQDKNYVPRKPLEIGAQDVFWESKPKFPISHALVGHSDRRYGLGESDEVVSQKLKKSLEAEIIPILLVGEREGENREEVLKNQLEKNLADFSADQISKILFAYEPVWAISTNPGGHPDTPENALEAIKFIQEFIFENFKLKIENCLYGGSVSEDNVAGFLNYPEISGAVVGKASLDPNQFSKILEIVNNI